MSINESNYIEIVYNNRTDYTNYTNNKKFVIIIISSLLMLVSFMGVLFFMVSKPKRLDF